MFRAIYFNRKDSKILKKINKKHILVTSKTNNRKYRTNNRFKIILHCTLVICANIDGIISYKCG